MNDGNAEGGPSMPRASTQERIRQAQIDEEERGRASELARIQTVNFLSKLTKEGRASDYRRRETDELVEKCYFSCSQGYAVVQGQSFLPKCRCDRDRVLARTCPADVHRMLS